MTDAVGVEDIEGEDDFGEGEAGTATGAAAAGGGGGLEEREEVAGVGGGEGREGRVAREEEWGPDVGGGEG